MATTQVVAPEPYTACFIIDYFRNRADQDLADKAIGYLVDALVRTDIDYLRKYPNTIDLYRANVIYKADNPLRPERWKPIPVLLQEGVGDCKDLASMRVAEYVVKHNVHAVPHIVHSLLPDGRHMYHVQLRLPNGVIEDPSVAKGMKV